MSKFDINSFILKAREIDDEEFEMIYSNSWSNMKSFKKFETLQTYNVGENSYTFFKEKKYNEFVNELKTFYEFNKSEFENIKADARVQRLRYIIFPLSLYIQHEYYSYLISEKLGESIRFISQPSCLKDIVDFILFDKSTLLINLFSKEYSFEKTLLFEDPSEGSLGVLYDDFECLFDSAITFKDLMKPDSEIIELLNQSVP